MGISSTLWVLGILFPASWARLEGFSETFSVHILLSTFGFGEPGVQAGVTKGKRGNYVLFWILAFIMNPLVIIYSLGLPNSCSMQSVQALQFCTE